ncbi:hypothetical protein CY34DRAFT_111051, partial [Suillus luteus UH-Slu-Lm8-n1]
MYLTHRVSPASSNSSTIAFLSLARAANFARWDSRRTLSVATLAWVSTGVVLVTQLWHYFHYTFRSLQVGGLASRRAHFREYSNVTSCSVVLANELTRNVTRFEANYYSHRCNQQLRWMALTRRGGDSTPQLSHVHNPHPPAHPKTDGSLPASESPSMDLTGYSTVCQCTCGRSFAQLNAYANHQRTCKKRKKHLSNALSKAKELWSTKKRLCREEDKCDKLLAGSTLSLPTIAHSAETWTSQAGESGAHPQLDHGFVGSEFTSDQAIVNGEGIETEGDEWCSPSESLHVADDPRSLAERRPRRINRRLPARFRDILPQPPPITEPALPPTADLSPTSETSAPLSRTLRFFRTLPSIFGLSRRYYSDRLPTHDPEELTTLENLTLTHSESDQDF